MTMEDVSAQVETFIEGIFRKRHGDQYGKLQVQVYRAMNEAGTKQLDFGSQVSECLNPHDTVTMATSAKPSVCPHWVNGLVLLADMLDVHICRWRCCRCSC